MKAEVAVWVEARLLPFSFLSEASTAYSLEIHDEAAVLRRAKDQQYFEEQ